MVRPTDLIDAYDMVHDFADLGCENEEILEQIVWALNDRIWLQRGSVYPTVVETLRFSWDRFSKLAKYSWRYTLLSAMHSGTGVQNRSPASLLREILVVAQRASLLIMLSKGTLIFRARVHSSKEKANDAKSLGTPTAEKIRNPNRMSPAGIAVFYGALESETARCEGCSQRSKGNQLTIGEFYNNKAIGVLDLSVPLSLPGTYSDEVGTTDAVEFLNRFGELVSARVSRETDSGLDYVPTQVFSEFVRMSGMSRTKVRGIIFRSSQHEGGRNLVLFYGPEDCKDPGQVESGDDCLVLRAYSRTRIASRHSGNPK